MDITELKRALVDRAAEVAEHLLPRGRRVAREWVVGSVAGEAGESLKVCVQGPKSGVWTDFAEGGEGGDLIDLWCAVRGVQLPQALDQIREWLGVERPAFERRERTYRRPERPRCQAPKSDVLAYLTGERLLSDEAIRTYRIGEQERTIVFPYMLPSGVLAAVKYLGLDRSPEGKKIIRAEAGCEPVLFGWQAIANVNVRECTLTEGEIDALTAFDYGLPCPLSLPFGGGKGAKQQWIESEFERLAQFEVIYLALDMDPEGEAAAEEIANRLGRHRCRRVILPRKDLNECRKTGIGADEIKQAFAAARSLDPPELRRAGEFTDEVLRLFWPAEGREPGYRLPFAKIGDKLVFRPGEMTIWTGPSGAGKSQLLSHALVDFGDQGARVCIASLEMAPRQTLKRMAKQSGSVDRPTEQYLRAIMDWIDSWCWMLARVGKVTVKSILDLFEYARARHGCDVFVIDSLMRLGVGSEDYEGQEKAVFEIVSWAVEKAVHVHLVAHARKADRVQGGPPELEDIKGASEIGSNAFNILGIWRNRKLEDEIKAAEASGSTAILAGLMEQPPVLLNVAKQRNGDWEGKIGLWFDQSTYQYRSAHDPKYGKKYVRLLGRDTDAA